MASGFREVLELRPRPERGLAVFALLLAGSASVSILLAALPPGAAIVALAAILGGTAAGLRRHFCDRRVSRALLLPDGRWRLCVGDSEPVSARLVSSWGESLGPLVALQWECAPDHRYSAWLVVGDLPAPAWRRLRVRLRLA